MVFYSNFKINLSLNLLFRRSDGFTEIESLFYPVRSERLCDMVEIVERGDSDGVHFSNSGIVVDCAPSDNLCVRAYSLLQEEFSLPTSVDIHLHKRIPFGAGLGAGSANATTVLKITNELFDLNLNDDQLERYSARLGSDTAFFVRQRPSIATSRGEVLSPVEVDLSGYYLLLVKPEVIISTAEAYRLAQMSKVENSLREVIHRPVALWHELLTNDFERPIFALHPILSQIKEDMYRSGALFSAMSGSGSTIFGLYDTPPQLTYTDHFSAVLRL